MRYTYKFRLYPTDKQKALLDKHFGCVRFVYNHFLAERKTSYEESGKSLNYYDNANSLPSLKQELPWLKEINAQSLQQAVKNLQETYQRFFRKKSGFPKFKKKGYQASFRIPQYIKLVDGRLSFPKVKGIKVKQERQVEGKIKSVTVSKNSVGQYFVAILVEREIVQLPQTNKVIGIDLNVAVIVDSNGNKTLNQVYDGSKLRKLSKSFSRKKKGGQNREKAKYRVAKFHNRVRNKREDFLHKYSWNVINENQVICVEDLNVKGMLEKNGKTSKTLRRSVASCGFASLLTKLEYKAKMYGRQFVKVGRYYPSSQLCSNCGYQYTALPKGCKSWKCQECGVTHNRDINAAINIKTAGMVGLACCPDVRPIRQLVGQETPTL